MKIIHCADVHLDSALTTHLSRGMAENRRNEILHTFRRMLSYADGCDADAVIIAGDLFDTETVSAHTVRTVLSEIRRYPHMEVFCLGGNHDRGVNVWGGFELPENLKLFGREWTYYRLGKVVIAGVCPDAEGCGRIYDELELDESDINIVTLHGQVRDYMGAADENTILTDRLKGRGIDYLALGHVHEYTLKRLDARAVYCYPGCLEGRGFDECGEHGFVALDIEGQSVHTEFVPFAGRRLFEVEVDVTGASDTAQAADLIQRTLGAENVKASDMVRILLTGVVDAESEINTDYLAGQLEDTYYYVRVKDRTKLSADRLVYAKEESLKGEFVRTVMASDMSDEDKGAVIQMGMRALAGEELWIV